MGVPQGLAKTLKDLQRVLEVLTEATAQELEENAASRYQNEVLQAAVNALQFQMASVGQGGPEINVMHMQQQQPRVDSITSDNGTTPEQEHERNPSGPLTAMAGTPRGPITEIAGSANQQPTFSTKGTRQGPRKRSRTQQNVKVTTRRIPGRGPAHATPATAATKAWKYTGRISTATTNAIREPTPSPHQLLILLVPWVCGQCPAQQHDVHELRTGTPDQLNSSKHNGR